MFAVPRPVARKRSSIGAKKFLRRKRRGTTSEGSIVVGTTMFSRRVRGRAENTASWQIPWSQWPAQRPTRCGSNASATASTHGSRTGHLRSDVACLRPSLGSCFCPQAASKRISGLQRNDATSRTKPTIAATQQQRTASAPEAQEAAASTSASPATPSPTSLEDSDRVAAATPPAS